MHSRQVVPGFPDHQQFRFVIVYRRQVMRRILSTTEKKMDTHRKWTTGDTIGMNDPIEIKEQEIGSELDM